MNLWCSTSSMEGEMFVSVHLTEEGAMRAAIEDIMDFLSIEAGDTRETFDNVPLCTDPEVLKTMTSEELLIEYRKYSEETWDNDCGFSIEIVRSQLAA